jgi:hypothetical protein
MPIPYRQELSAFIDEFADLHRGVRRGKMFGLPAIYVGRKLVTCLIEDGIIVRLPDELARREIRAKRGEPFTRRERERSNWILYRPRNSVSARSLTPLIEKAARAIAERQTEEITGVRMRSKR